MADWKKMSGLRASVRGTLLMVWVLALLIVANLHLPEPVRAVAGQNCPAGQHCIYIPIISAVSAPPSTTDLLISGLEINQAVQDASNTVPLVAGRPAMLRMYAQSGGVSQPVTNVRISVAAARSGKALADSPRTFVATVPLIASRADYSSTVNLQLPATWLSGTVDLTVTLDPDNAIREKNETNNKITQRVTFTTVPPLKVMIVPVQYTHTTSTSSHIYPAPVSDTISSWIMRTYPVNQVVISWHAPYAFKGNLTTQADFGKLLDQITSLRASEGAPAGQVYYALVPTSDSSGAWFYGGLAGLAWVGGTRAAVGLNVSGTAGQLAAHEIGHNLGMSHTPCGSVAGADPNYPYKDGSIGQFGLDVSSGKLYNPSTSKDVMSYCDPKWISDYTYKVLFNDQVRTGAAALTASLVAEPSADSRSILVRAIVTGSSAQFSPAYVLTGTAASLPEPGPYQVQVLDEQGQVITEVDVRANTAELEDGGTMEGIHALIPITERPAALLRLLKDGQLLAEQAILPEASQQVNLQTSQGVGDAVTVTWENPDQPAMLRYSPDGGYTWQTVQVDATGGTVQVNLAGLPAPDGMFEVIPANTWR